MNRSLLTLLLLPSAITAQSPQPLHDGQQITLHGTLTMQPAGRLQFVTVKTTTSYVPIFQEPTGKQAPGETLHQVGIAGYADYALLYAHRDQQVTVTGRLATDEATPYFWHGTRLQAASIRTANGTDLLGKPDSTRIAADTGLYRAGVTLPADLAAPWRYTLEGRPAARNTYLTCSSNGGGDVVNCFCAQGFHPIETKSSIKASSGQGQIFSDTRMAQFEVGDDPRAAKLSITCSR